MFKKLRKPAGELRNGIFFGGFRDIMWRTVPTWVGLERWREALWIHDHLPFVNVVNVEGSGLWLVALVLTEWDGKSPSQALHSLKPSCCFLVGSLANARPLFPSTASIFKATKSPAQCCTSWHVQGEQVVGCPRQGKDQKGMRMEGCSSLRWSNSHRCTWVLWGRNRQNRFDLVASMAAPWVVKQQVSFCAWHSWGSGNSMDCHLIELTVTLSLTSVISLPLKLKTDFFLLFKDYFEI